MVKVKIWKLYLVQLLPQAIFIWNITIDVSIVFHYIQNYMLMLICKVHLRLTHQSKFTVKPLMQIIMSWDTFTHSGMVKSMFQI